MTPRRTAALLLAVGTACLASAALPLVAAEATPAPGSGLGQFALSANAPVAQVREDYAAQRCGAEVAGTAGCEGVLNETVSELSSGPVGYALSSVVWPGTLAGNLGTLIIVTGSGGLPVPVPVPVPLPTTPPPPPQTEMLNSPVRAEARTGGKGPVVTDYPGHGAPAVAHMLADATGTKVTAQAALGPAQSTALGRLGASSSWSRTELTGPATAAATAHSEVANITLASVVHLGTVTSDATATTTGTAASAHGKTVITGASIAGVPVTIDETGVHVQGQGGAVPSALTDAVNTALKNAGMRIVLSTPSLTHAGASAAYSAGSLVFSWKQQDGMFLTAIFGGAQVSVASAPAFVCGAICNPVINGGTTGGTTTTTGGTVVPPTFRGNTGPGTTGAPAPTTGTPQVAPQLAARRLALPHGLSPWLGVMAVLGAGFVVAGLRRLPDRVLATPATACPQGETA